MKEKILAAITLATVPTVSASHGGSSSLASLEGVINMLGLTRGDMVHNLGLAATFGLLWLSVYMILKKIIVDVLEAGELFNLESSGVQDDDKKNLLAVLALLVVLSMLGTGHAMGFIWDLQMLLVGGLFFGVIALIIVVVGGGSAGVAWTAGKTGKALNHGIEEAKDARDRLRNVGQTDVSDNPDETEAEVESIVEEIDDSDDHVEGAMNNAAKDLSDDIDHINDAINEVKNASREYDKLSTKIEYFEKAVKNIGNRMRALRQASTSGGSPNLDDLEPKHLMNGTGPIENTNPSAMGLPGSYQNFGLKDVRDLAVEIIDTVERIERKEEYVTSELDDELNKLIAESKTVTKSLKAINLLMQDVDQAEDYEERIEQYAREISDEGLFERARRTEQHEEELENSLEQLKNRKSSIQNQLTDLKSVLNSELQISQSEKNDIESKLGDIQQSSQGSIFNHLQNISDVRDDLNGNNNCTNPDFPNNTVDQYIDGHIPQAINDLRDDLQALYNANNHEIKDDHDLIEAIDEALDGLQNWKDSF